MSALREPARSERPDHYAFYRHLILAVRPGERAAVKRAFELARRVADTADYRVAFLAMVHEFIGAYEGTRMFVCPVRSAAEPATPRSGPQ